jgi:hypothetical protein
MTGRYNLHEMNNKVALLRRHGFMWQGRGGEHVAKKIGDQRKATV